MRLNRQNSRERLRHRRLLRTKVLTSAADTSTSRYMSNKNLVRIVVLAALFAWPGVEFYRLQAAKQDLAARRQVQTKVTQRLAMAKQKTQVAQAPGDKQ